MILIVYYSWQGHTEKVAAALAKRVGAGLAEIRPVSEVGMFRKGMMSMLGMRAPIQPVQADLADVDLLVVATPVWSRKIPPYVNEYLSRVTNGRGKPFSVIAEMGGSGGENAIAIVRKALEAKGMRFVSSATTIESDVDAGRIDRTIEEFARTIAKAPVPAV